MGRQAFVFAASVFAGVCVGACSDAVGLAGGTGGSGESGEEVGSNGSSGSSSGDEGSSGGGSEGDGGEEDCSDAGQKQFVFEQMQSKYLWWDLMPEVDVADFDDARSLAVGMRYTQLDRWTRVKNKAIANAWTMEGKFIGYGFSTRRDADDNVRISIVDANSPASAAGVFRGYKIISINGISKEELDDTGGWSSAYGPSEPGISADFVFEDLTGAQFSTTLTRDWIDSVSVPVHRIFDTPSGQVGYILFTKFVSDAREELDAAFDAFSAAGVRRLIIDLRYNGGGTLSMARHLNNLAAGARAEGEISYELRHNEFLAQDKDRTYLFENLPNSLDPVQVVFITTGSTQSASETVINGILPHTQVDLVGSPTAGKPVGTKNYEFCEQLLSPISFRMNNSNGDADYYDGFPVDCDVSDDLLHQLGDEDEGMLAAALALAVGGSCPAP